MSVLKRIASLVSLGALTAGLGVTMSGAAQASVIPASTWNEIFSPFDNRNSNTMCVDVPNGQPFWGVGLQLWHCHGYASNGGPQRWQFHPQNEGYLIANADDGLCISPVPSNTSLIEQAICSPSMQWDIIPMNPDTTNPLFMLSLHGTGLCLSAKDFSDSNGEKLTTAACTSFNDLMLVWELG
jgi:hypothetical protein